ncbi:MAG: transporter substrate-binding domain-containing protein [Clostridia bacterium]|nr:transporter substrate-binding domain-containing protein [Clostridia bacterium]
MRKICLALVLGTLLSLLLCGCTTDNPNQDYILLKDLKGEKVGVVDGITEETLVKDNIPNAKLKSFATVEEGVQALRDKKIKALILNPRNAEKYLKGDSDFVVMMQKLADKEYKAATYVQDYTESDSFVLEIESTLSKLRHTGEYDKIYGKYFEQKAPEVLDFDYNAGTVKDRVLTVGVAEDNAPFSYLDKNGKYTGFDVEFANEVAKTWGAKLEIKAYPRGKLLNATRNGEVKMILGRLTALDDKDKNDWMLFSQSYYDASQLVILNAEDVNSQK